MSDYQNSAYYNHKFYSEYYDISDISVSNDYEIKVANNYEIRWVAPQRGYLEIVKFMTEQKIDSQTKRQKK
ncbi:hypothetical protein QLL95_gp0424 [Cotonvirus japonicus]|uniref:Uncharacterized protein n=1 Tax=Cotonvirus japonicus TaxID=2811091 RepID=A0ABM7NU90_9VIRU|nr:hypothetical protein QLL95_gp0424 [Cotonvirus japonicus]BCS83699.1 hypothetical protein [Cotonvirus japonicus]